MLTENKVGVSKASDQARRYLKLPFDCDLTTYGQGVVASVSENLVAPETKYLATFKGPHCIETPNLLVLQNYLEPLGLSVCFMAEYFLPDLTLLKDQMIPFETRVLRPDDFKNLYNPEWANALCEHRKHLDVLAVGAYDKGQLIGLAGCSADCDDMWQIGIDVLPHYRNQGIASALTSKLALEVIKRDKVPFYCCAWSNISSVRNAIKSGFKPASVQMTVKPRAFVDDMNKHIHL